MKDLKKGSLSGQNLIKTWVTKDHLFHFRFNGWDNGSSKDEVFKNSKFYHFCMHLKSGLL